MVVATALCADRVATAAPVPDSRPQPSNLARLASKLTGTFRQVVPSVRLLASRRDGEQNATRPEAPVTLKPVVHATQASPFRFRLPPPTV